MLDRITTNYDSAGEAWLRTAINDLVVQQESLVIATLDTFSY